MREHPYDNPNSVSIRMQYLAQALREDRLEGGEQLNLFYKTSEGECFHLILCLLEMHRY